MSELDQGSSVGGYPIVTSGAPGVSTTLLAVTPPGEPQVVLLTPPTAALSLSAVANASSTLAATTYYVAVSYQNLAGSTPVGTSEASIAIATANADGIQFATTPPSGVTSVLVGIGTASGAEDQIASVALSNAAVTYISPSTAGVSASVSGGTLTIQVFEPAASGAPAMPTVNTALSSPVSTIAPPAAPTLAQAADSTGLAATTYYVKISNGAANAVGNYAWTPTSAEASIAISAAGNNITFSSTLPTGATALLIGMGTASGGEAEFAYVDSAAAVTYIGTNYEGIAATVSGSTLSVTITEPPQDTSHPMPMTYLAATTTYTYAETALSAFDNTETTVSPAVSQTTDVAYPVMLNLQTSAGAGNLNVYKNGNFLSTSPSLQYIDNGDVDTTSAVPPSSGFTNTGVLTLVSQQVGAIASSPTFTQQAWTGSAAIGVQQYVDGGGTLWVNGLGETPNLMKLIQSGTVSLSVFGEFSADSILLPSATPVVTAGFISRENSALYLGNGSVANPINVLEDPAEVELTTTTATTIFTVTPATVGRYVLWVYVRLLADSPDLTVTLTYTDNSGAQTATLLNAQAITANGPILPYYFQAVAGDAITLSCTSTVASALAINASLEVK